MDSISHYTDTSSQHANQDTNQIKDLIHYMVELVSLSLPKHKNNDNNHRKDDYNDSQLESLDTCSQYCLVNQDDDQVTTQVKDLVDYMLELVSTAVPFNAPNNQNNNENHDDNDEIEIIDLEKSDSDPDSNSQQSVDRFNSNENLDNCFICGQNNEIKYQIKVNGKVHNSCSWDCVLKLKNNDYCVSCCTLIPPDTQGYRPNFGGGNATLCSEQCLIKFDVEHEPNTKCFTCYVPLTKDKTIFYWQTMEFCSAECVQTKQLVFGSKCAQCQASVNRQSLGKYSVRFGDIIKQFCIGTCLEAFKKSLKVCAFCQKDLKLCSTICIATFGYGDKMRLREFCDQICKSQYELMINSRSSYQIHCNQCQRIVDNKTIIDFTFDNKKYSICSSSCVAAFKYNNKLKTIFCDNCHKYGWTNTTRTCLHVLHYSGMTRVFCTKKCLSMFVLKNRKIVACLCCKVKKYNFDLIERFDWTRNDSRLFCSLNCLTLFDMAEAQKDIKSNTIKVKCDHCSLYAIPQFFFKTDESLRNFCSYQCVFQYQRQFAPSSLIALPSTTNPNNQTVSNMITLGNSTTLSSSSIQSHMWTPSFFSSPQRPENQSKSPAVSTPILLSQIRSSPLSGPRRPVPSNIPLSTVNKTLPSTVPAITTNVNSLAIPSSNTSSEISSSPAGNQTTIKEIVKETKEVIVKVPTAVQMKNKCTLFRPPSQTKATSCRPYQVNAEVQTDPEMKTICPILLPVPIFVPIPVSYMQPLAFPLPLPVPVFFPLKDEPPRKSQEPENPQQTSFNSDNLNLTEQQIGELLRLPEELLGESQTVDETVVQNILMDNSYNQESDPSSSKRKLSEPESEDRAPKRGRPPGSTSRGRGRGRGRGARGGRRGKGFNRRYSTKEWEMCSEEEDEEGVPLDDDEDFQPEGIQIESSNTCRSSDNRVFQQQQHYSIVNTPEHQMDQSMRIVLSAQRGRGRGRRSNASTPTHSPAVDLNIFSSAEEPKRGRRGRKRREDEVNESGIESQFSTNTTNNGINALRIWLRQSPQYVNTKNILELHQNYLSEIFCKFVEEICQVHGQDYSPDYIYLLCLDLQRHLAENNRLDNIFMDAAYKQFIHAIHIRLVGYNPQLTCIVEEKLWECGQLGAHSPTVLLNTVMYLATKYFHMTQLEEHMQFAFSNLQKGWNHDGTQCLIYSSVRRGRGRKRTQTVEENVENQLRCPVKLFEFYLSKCPENVCQRRDMFYLYPIEGCVPDSSTWYSPNPLTNASVSKMLQRILVVREIVALGSQPNL